jgi:hypothetical protein
MTEPGKSPFPGAKILLMGPAGTGKTHSIRTLIEAGITPFCIFTEPGMEVVGDVPCPKLHFKYIAPALSNWNALADIATRVNQLSYEGLMKLVDANKNKYTQFIDVIRTNNDFVCDRCGKSFGDVQFWGTNRALVVDSLTGLGKMVVKLHLGARPVMQQQEWQVTQNTLMPLLDAWAAGGTRCWFVLIAHEAMERDEVSGTIKRMVSTLGRAIAPQIPNFFSDVIECVRLGDKFSWDTAAVNADTKTRNLPIRSAQNPSFVPLVASWVGRGGIIETESPSPEPLAVPLPIKP